MHLLDWLIVGGYLVLCLVLGLYFTRRAGRDIDAFFASGRQLTWFLSGISLIATSFASDTPLWITSLIRHYGVHYVWQYWAPAIGAALAVVLFARWWRRLGVLTDLEMLEVRYSGPPAAALRGALALLTSLLFCPLIIGWVTKAMEVITRETLGLPEDFRLYTTLLVIAVALGSCALSGLWGVIYTDLVQFFLAVIGTTALAVVSVQQVGGLDAMVEKLHGLSSWQGNHLNLAPQIGSGPGEMTIWNFIGYFGLLWMHVAYSGGFQAQRLLACKDGRHASFAMLTLTILYYAAICWPWVLVGLCSLLILPDLGTGLSQDQAYPRMIVLLMPIGLKGVLVTAMLAAFMSTISTLFNWGSSYLVNDFYKRFVVRDAKLHHYVNVGRLATVVMAVLGAWISFKADYILQLVTIAFVMWAGLAAVGILRWLWWRQNAAGELAATLWGYALAAAMIFGGVLDGPARAFFGAEVTFSSDPDLLGARMLLVVVSMTLISIVVSLVTTPSDEAQLERFLLKARPFHYFWRPVIQRLNIEYHEGESLARTLFSWALVVVAVYGLLFGVGKLLLGEPLLGTACCTGGLAALWLTVRRVNQDFAAEEAIAQKGIAEKS